MQPFASMICLSFVFTFGGSHLFMIQNLNIMKNYLVLPALLFVVFASCSAQKMNISIKGNDQFRADDVKFENYNATLRSKVGSNVDVAVVSVKTGEQVSGFGLGRKATIFVGEGNILVLKNNSDRQTKISAEIVEVVKESQEPLPPAPPAPPSPAAPSPSVNAESPTTPTPPKMETKYINFTLENKSLKSIPLIIPTVMNPNLSPISKSGVRLRVGQEILFKFKGKKRVLLIVSEEIKDGDIIEVSEILKQRKLEIQSK